MDRRTQIVQATIALVAREGFAHASSALIAREARVPQSTFDAHFRSCEDCFAAAQAEVAGRVARASEDALAAGGEPCSALTRCLFDFAAGHTAPAQLLFCESLAAGEGARRRRDALVATIASLLDERWRREEEASRGPDLPAATVVAVVFRALATTLRSEARRLSEVRAGVLAWADSYGPASERYRWRESARQIHGRTLEAPSVPSTLQPAASPVGEREEQPRSRERLRILEAVALVAYWRDLVNVRTTDVLQATGLTEKALHRHFEDLEAAALAAFELGYELAMGSASRAFFGEGRWPERVWAVSRAASGHGREHPTLTHLAYAEPHALSPHRFEAVRQRLLVATLLFEEGYRASAQAALVPRIVSEILAMAIFEIAYREAPRRGATRLPQLAAQRAYVMLAPFLGPEDASEFVAARLEDEPRARERR